MTSGAAQNLGILYPDTELPAKVEFPPLSSKGPLDDVFEEDGEIEDQEEKDAGKTERPSTCLTIWHCLHFFSYAI